MLVSSIARFSAINQMNNASMAMMHATDTAINAIGDSNAFGGEHDLAMLNKLDKKLSLDLATNRLLYKLAYLQEKMFANKEANEASKNKLSVLA